jgi:hypothetical protein
MATVKHIRDVVDLLRPRRGAVRSSSRLPEPIQV